MENASLGLRIKQALIGLGLICVAALFIVPPLLAPDYSVQQGSFRAHIVSSISGMGMAGRPIVRAQVEDETGRIFWLQLPPTYITAPDVDLLIDVWCLTPDYESCTARYKPG